MSKAVRAASKIMANPKASPDAKAMAATILAQSRPVRTVALRAPPAGLVLRDPKASRAAKSAAASALTQKQDRRFGPRMNPLREK